MRISWEHDIDGLRTWADLCHHLGDHWRQVHVRRTGLTLSRHFGEVLVDEPASGTAAQRRALHRAGFRRRDEHCWGWTPPEPSDLPPPSARLPPLVASAWRWSERESAMDAARTAQVVHVLREVYAAAPAEIVVTIAEDDEDEWDDEEDEYWPVRDCAALEVLALSRRRRT